MSFFLYFCHVLAKNDYFCSKEEERVTVSDTVLSDFRRGDLRSFYAELYPSLLRYAERALGNGHAHEAADCVQEVVYRVYQSRREFRDGQHMRTFLFACIHNEIVSLHRKTQTRHRFLAGEHEDTEDRLFDDLVMQETLDRLYQAIEQLPQHLREIFDLSFREGLQNAEVAARLRVSVEAVKKRKARLVSLLRERFRGDASMTFLLNLPTFILF